MNWTVIISKGTWKQDNQITSELAPLTGPP